MKKSIITSAIALIITGSAFAQPVSDRAVIPLGVTLQQILRISVTNGGNIEFVFNTITDYKTGIANGATGFYDSRFTIASSTNFELHMGAEDATLIGTDNPVRTLALNNVGFLFAFNGLRTVTTTHHAMGLAYNNSNTIINGLRQFTGVNATDGLLTNGVLGNGGDILDNDFTINWSVGIIPASAGTNPTNGTSILSQSIAADRYVTNVFLDINAL